MITLTDTNSFKNKIVFDICCQVRDNYVLYQHYYFSSSFVNFCVKRPQLLLY